MTTTRNLLESARLVETDLSADTWKVRLISEGKGSSGIYPASTLEKYAHAFNDVLSFENHPAGWDGLEARNFKQIVGRVIGETWTETDERGKLGVYANWKPDADHKAKLSEYKDALGLSIYIEGEGHINEDGDFEIDMFNAMDPFRSVDVVIAAGRGGRFEESFRDLKTMYDSRRSESEKPGVTSAQENGKLSMEKDVEERFTALETLLQTLVAKEQDSKAEAAQAEADENAGRAAVEAYDAAVVAIDAAELPEKVVESLRAQAKEGKDVTAMIEQAVAIKEASDEAAKARLGESAPGREFGARKVESATELGKVFG